MNTLNLLKPADYFRTPVLRGFAGKVEPEGGDHGAGLITGASVITRGPADGHGMWVDRQMVRDVSEAINASTGGIKSRFAHPSMSGDGLGRFLGRFRNAKVTDGGDVVRADLHFSETSRKTPEGDLADYVLSLATESPDMFGTSIVFELDEEAMDMIGSKHAGKSPDKRNTEDLPHVRMSRLRAVDTVDEPAANPKGLFHVQHGEFLSQIDPLVKYALGIGDKPVGEFEIDPDRLRDYLSRLLEREGYRIESGRKFADDKATVARKERLREYTGLPSEPVKNQWVFESRDNGIVIAEVDLGEVGLTSTNVTVK